MSTVRGEQDRKLLSRLHASRDWDSDRRVCAEAKQTPCGQPENQARCEPMGAQNRPRRAHA
jgi:hypothetical protein